MTKQDEDILKQVMKGTYNPEENYTYSSLKEIAKRGISAGKQEGIEIGREQAEKQNGKTWLRQMDEAFENGKQQERERILELLREWFVEESIYDYTDWKILKQKIQSIEDEA